LPGMEFQLEDVGGVPEAPSNSPARTPVGSATGGGSDSETDGGAPEDYQPSNAVSGTKPGPGWTPGNAGDVGPGSATGENEDSD